MLKGWAGSGTRNSRIKTKQQKIKMNYFNLPSEYSDFEKAKVVIIPVPFEETVTYKKGTINGPKAIEEATFDIEPYEHETDSEPIEVGVNTFKEIKLSTAEETINKLEVDTTRAINNEKFPIILGGEHSISFGAIKALKKEYPNLTILHLDAHVDLNNDFDGDKFNHSCVMRRASELDIPLVQVGIRNMSFEEKTDVEAGRINTKIFKARNIMTSNNNDWIQHVLEELNGPVYISIDLDAFDPAIMPSTGTPEPGGLDWYKVTNLLKQTFLTKEVVGADIVELAPIKNLHAPDFMAAKLMYKLIAYKFFLNKEH